MLLWYTINLEKSYTPSWTVSATSSTTQSDENVLSDSPLSEKVRVLYATMEGESETQVCQMFQNSEYQKC